MDVWDFVEDVAFKVGQTGGSSGQGTFQITVLSLVFYT